MSFPHNPGGGLGQPAPQPPARRPRARWYVIGAVLAVLGFVGGLGLFVATVILTAYGAAPTDAQTFGNNGSTTVHIDVGASKTIFVAPQDISGQVHCTARGGSPANGPEITPYKSNIGVNQWRAAFTLTVHDSDDYAISCTGPAGARFGVGDHVAGSDIVYPFIAVAVGGVLVIAGLVIVIVTAV
ncbi:MAG: hypothetical protein JO280_10010, partial [Mycobacteriaceae bacterium]|nr:hypothetical protein [Mycobacteriaceae bacterium]